MWAVLAVLAGLARCLHSQGELPAAKGEGESSGREENTQGEGKFPVTEGEGAFPGKEVKKHFLVLRERGSSLVLKEREPSLVLKEREPPLALNGRGPSLILKERGPSLVQKEKETSLVQKERGTSLVQKERETSLVQKERGPLPSWQLQLYTGPYPLLPPQLVLMALLYCTKWYSQLSPRLIDRMERMGIPFSVFASVLVFTNLYLILGQLWHLGLNWIFHSTDLLAGWVYNSLCPSVCLYVSLWSDLLKVNFFFARSEFSF